MKIQKYLVQSPVFALYQAQNLMLNKIQTLLLEYDVHFLQALILAGLFFEVNEVRPRDLVRAYGVSMSNLSHSLKGLEKKGLIKRSLCSGDSRGYAFALSPSGKLRAQGLIRVFDQIQNELEASLGVKSFRDFVKGVHAVVDAYQTGFPENLKSSVLPLV